MSHTCAAARASLGLTAPPRGALSGISLQRLLIHADSAASLTQTLQCHSAVMTHKAQFLPSLGRLRHTIPARQPRPLSRCSELRHSTLQSLVRPHARKQSGEEASLRSELAEPACSSASANPPANRTSFPRPAFHHARTPLIRVYAYWRGAVPAYPCWAPY